ncbi:MAG TPA: restriction endonuclease [Pseudonocardiaceae bacterium]|jgi:restriction system protein|nr:restriction endonuclease [Pseudonocardiaceae bacterium]
MHAWLIRAGKAGERERWALDKGWTGAGFGEIRDLSALSDRAAVLAAVTDDVPDAQSGTVRNFAAQLWALRGRMGIGDLVVMPRKNSPYLAIGRVTGDYQYASDESDPERRHRRSVEWVVSDVPRTLVKQDLLYSLGAFSTICEISRNDAAFRLGQLMSGKPDPGARAASNNAAKQIESTDEASDIGQSEIDVETYVRDRITSRVIENFAGHRLADLVAAILEAGGYSCDVSPEGTDQGVDIIAGKGLLGLTSPKIVVQVKSEAGSAGCRSCNSCRAPSPPMGLTMGCWWPGVGSRGKPRATCPPSDSQSGCGTRRTYSTAFSATMIGFRPTSSVMFHSSECGPSRRKLVEITGKPGRDVVEFRFVEYGPFIVDPG